MIHRVPRFAACSPAELGGKWKNLEPVARITTLTFFEGDLDHVIEDTEKGDGIGERIRSRPWCGQTAFTFPVDPDSQSEPQDAARQDPSRNAAGDLPGRESEGEWCQVASEEVFESDIASETDPDHYVEDMM